MSELALKLIAENKKTKSKTLDLGNCGLTELPLEALECEWVEELILSNEWNEFDHENNQWEQKKSQNSEAANKITFLSSSFSHFRLLKKLVIRDNQIADLAPIAALTNLQQLNCSSNQIVDLAPVTTLTNLKILDCSSNNITDLTPLATLTNLQQLYCSFNQIVDLAALAALTNLQQLNCSSNQIADLTSLATLTNLQQLDCSSNQVSSLTPITSLINLQIHDCSSNQIADLDSIATLTNLQILYCSFNKIEDLAPIATLINLQQLSCSSNQIEDLTAFTGLINLQQLSFAFNKVANLTPLSALTNLRTLSCSSNRITDLGALVALTNLQQLDCSSNQIANLAPLSTLTNLQQLDCSSNQIADLAPFAVLIHLQQLDCSSNMIANLAPLATLTNLQQLDCSSNQIANLTPLATLTNLQQLDCSSNWITDLTPFATLTNLQQFDCSSNQIADLSPILFLIEKVIAEKWHDFSEYSNGNTVKGQQKYTIRLIDNPLKSPSASIVQQGNEAILNFFKQVAEQGTIPLYEAKLIIVGEPGAGKTSLAEKLLDEKHHVIPNDPAKKSTLGINIRENWHFPDCKRIGEYFISHIWDFGGQDIQYMTHQFFLTPESLYVLVADDRKQHTLFPYWFEVIHLLGKDDDGKYSPIIVVLNEHNHKSITNFDLNEYRLKYPDTRIKMVEVDLSDERLERFRVVRDEIQQSLCSLDHIGRPLPAMWPKIREALLQLSNTQNYIDESKFVEICQSFGISNKEDRQLISKYLHQLGVILHFKNDNRLRDFIVISPKWALKAVYTVLEDREVKNNFGKFTDTDLDRYWKEFTNQERLNILELMMKKNFDICYRIGNDTYIAPQLLSQIRPTFDWDNKSSLKCQFFYRFMPKGIMTRLIVRKHMDLANDDFVWARGAIFSRFDCAILVTEEETEHNGLIAIEVTGKNINRTRALDFIRNEIEEIHKKWFDNIEYEERAPCNCTHCLNTPTPTFFAWKKLIQRVEEGRETIECDNVKVKDVPVIPLIEGYSGRERIKNSMRGRKAMQGYFEGGFEAERHSSLEVQQEPMLSKPTSSEPTLQTAKTETSFMEKLNLKLWFPMLFSAFLIWVFFAWANPGSKLDFFGWFKVEQGEDKKITSTIDKAIRNCTVQTAVKLNNDVPPNGLIKYLRPKNAPELMAAMNSGGIFLFRDCPIPKDKMLEFELFLSDGSKPISAVTTFVEPDENGVSKLRELLFDGTYDVRTKKFSNIVFRPSINIQQIQQNGEGNKATQEIK